MSKSKKTPEQEEEIVEKGKAIAAPESDKSPPAEETHEGGKAEEKPAGDPPEDKGDSEEKPSEEKPEEAEDSEKDEDKTPGDKEPPKDDSEKTPAAPEGEVSDREAQLQAELLEARGQLAAYAAGVDPSKISDAVILASAEAQKEGDFTEAGISKAMANVLKRHPEWKASGDGKKSNSGGFRMGADPDKSGSGRNTGSKANGNNKRWNRYK